VERVHLLINEKEDAQSIWQATYKDIGHAVSLILSEDFEGAFKYYLVLIFFDVLVGLSYWGIHLIKTHF
jgi:hypothetical protein